MHITDPVADMLTRVRNANNAKHETVDVPASNMKKSIAQILLDEGYIKSFTVEDDGLQGMIHITLKYNAGKEKVITGLRRVSKPGLRHTFATLALQNGVDVKTVSSMLGHYDAGFTLRTYTHATRQKQDEAAQTMGSFMAQVM